MRAHTSEFTIPYTRTSLRQEISTKIKTVGKLQARQLIGSALVRVQLVYRRRIVHASVIYRGTGVRDYAYP